MKKLTKYLITVIAFLPFFTGVSFAQNNTMPVIVNYLLSKSFINKLEVPAFTGLSQGKLIVECQDDVVYYIMAFNCLRSDTKPSVKTSIGTVVTEENGHIVDYNNDPIISTYYTKGHIERTSSITITGEVYSGGETLSMKWVENCEL